MLRDGPAGLLSMRLARPVPGGRAFCVLGFSPAASEIARGRKNRAPSAFDGCKAFNASLRRGRQPHAEEPAQRASRSMDARFGVCGPCFEMALRASSA